MKKNPIILPVAAIMALCLIASCCRNHKVTLVEEIPIVLNVSTSGTKAIIDGSDDQERLLQMINDCYNTDENKRRKAGAGFGVLGYKLSRDGSTTTKLFNNVLVYPSPDDNLTPIPYNTPWTYTPTKFWDMTASYQFIAYWPWSDQNFDSYDADKTLYLRNIPNWQPVDGTEKDYMTAVRTGSRAEKFVDGKVHLDFEHMLSQLVIKAYYIGKDCESTGGVTINAIQLSKSADGQIKVLNGLELNSDPKTNTTDFKQKYSDAQPSQATETVNGTAPNTIDLVDSYTLLSGGTTRIPYKDELENTFKLGNQTVTEPNTIGSWLMIPHKWQNLNISSTYTVGNEVINSVLSDAPKTPVTITAARDNYMTQPAKTYIITLVFDTTGGGLSVKQVIVQQWTEHEVAKEVYNW